MLMYHVTLFGGLHIHREDRKGTIRFRSRKGQLLLAYLATFPGRHSRVKLAHLLYPDRSESRALLSLRVELTNLRRVLYAESSTSVPLLIVDRNSVAINESEIFVDVRQFEWLLNNLSYLDDCSNISFLEQACYLYQGDYLAGYEASWIQAKREQYRHQFVNLIKHLCNLYINNSDYNKSYQILQYGMSRLPGEITKEFHEIYDIIEKRKFSHYSDQSTKNIYYMKRNELKGLLTIAALRWTVSDRTSQIASRCVTSGGTLIHRGDKLIIAAFDNPLSAAHWVSGEIDMNCDLSAAITMCLWSSENRAKVLSTVSQLVMSLNKGWIICTEPVAYWLRRDPKWILQEVQFYLYADGSERLFVLTAEQQNGKVMPHSESPFRQDYFPFLHKQPLPSFTKQLWGRERELEVLHRWYREACCGHRQRVLTITGIGGIGKTHLALEFANQVTNLFHDKVIFVQLENVHTSYEIEYALLSALHQDFPRLRIQLKHALSAHQLLIILDHVEHLKPLLTALLPEWLEHAPKLKVLATSRLAIGIPEEQVLILNPLMVPSEIATLEELSSYPSIKLFIDEARSVRPDFHLTPANASQVAAICRYADGVPLVIKLLAKQINVFSPNQLLIEIKKHSVRNDTLNPAVSWSFHQLPNDQQIIFCKLSVLNGRWTLEAAREILQEPLIHEYISRFLTAGLLVVNYEEDEYWFSIPAIVRESVKELLDASEYEALERRYALYYIHLICQLLNNCPPLTEAQLRQLHFHQEHILASLNWAVRAGESNIAAEAIILLLPFFEAIGLFEIPQQWGLQLMSQSLPPEKQARLANALARLHHRAGNYQLAEQMYHYAHGLAMQIGHCAAIAEALTGLAGVYLDNLSIHEAEPILRTVLSDYQDALSPIIRADALFRLGYAVASQMKIDEALQCIEQAADLYRQVGEKRYLALALNALGLFMLRRGHLAKAESLIQESINILQDIQDSVFLPFVLLRWGDIHKERGNYVDATHIYQKALEISKSMHLLKSQKAALIRLGEIYYFQRKYRQARSAFREACSLLDSLEIENRPPSIEKVWCALLNGSINDAESMLIQYLHWIRKENIMSSLNVILEILSIVFEKKNLLYDSIKLLEISLQLRIKWNFYYNIKYVKRKLRRLRMKIAKKSNQIKLNSEKINKILSIIEELSG